MRDSFIHMNGSFWYTKFIFSPLRILAKKLPSRIPTTRKTFLISLFYHYELSESRTTSLILRVIFDEKENSNTIKSRLFFFREDFLPTCGTRLVQATKYYKKYCKVRVEPQ